MQCPKCRGNMRTYERNGVHIEQCDNCRGIFLDYGELETLTRMESQYHAAPPPPPPARPGVRRTTAAATTATTVSAAGWACSSPPDPICLTQEGRAPVGCAALAVRKACGSAWEVVRVHL
ncbi:zf-TFIIB domain-containing protein [[Actinomadura] parvosata]|uniref:TFIIB-type zinc ribbon-containing protein n=1 Tax=[Actinomadura] parvosata TaxID=1955412 RepID=UPI00269EEFE4